MRKSQGGIKSMPDSDGDSKLSPSVKQSKHMRLKSKTSSGDVV